MWFESAKLALSLVMVCILVWPVHSQLTSEEETSNQVNNISTSNVQESGLAKSPLSDWFGSLFDSTDRVTPTKICDCSKFNRFQIGTKCKWNVSCE